MALTDRVTYSYDCGPKGRAGQGGKAQTRFSCAKLTTGNIVAQDGFLDAVEAALAQLTNGVIVREAIDHGQDFLVTTPATPLNKGEKWVCTVRENAGNQRPFTFTIPAADESGTHVAANTLNWNPADADWTALVSAIANLWSTPDGGAGTLIFATLLTRRR